MNKTLDLGKDSVLSLLIRYSIPAVLAMLVGAVYNIVDRIYIGQYIGEQALAGVTVDFPLMLAVMAIASMIEAGTSSIIAIELGKQNKRQAGKALGNAIGLGIGIASIVIILMYFNLPLIVGVLGGKGVIATYAISYMRVILMGIIVQIIAQILSSTVRVDGHPLLSMISMLVSAIINIILDYIFIAKFNMGVEGAAIATILGQTSGFIILLFFYLSGKSSFEFSTKDFIPDINLSIKTVSIGIASLVSVLGMSISMLLLNVQLLKYGNSSAITAIGIINGLYSFFIMPIIGIQQGLQPLMGYNFGAKQYNRVFKSLKLALIIAFVYSTILFIILQIFPETAISLFLKSNSSTIDVTKKGLRITTTMLPLLSVTYFGVAFYQSIGEAKIAFLLSLLRVFFIFVPALWILPIFWNLTGVWAAQPLADGLSILIVGTALVKSYRNFTKKSSPLISELEY